MKKELSESLIIIIIGLALIFFNAIVKLLGLIIVVYGLVELFRERKEKKIGEAQGTQAEQAKVNKEPTLENGSASEIKTEGEQKVE